MIGFLDVPGSKANKAQAFFDGWTILISGVGLTSVFAIAVWDLKISQEGKLLGALLLGAAALAVSSMAVLSHLIQFFRSGRFDYSAKNRHRFWMILFATGVAASLVVMTEAINRLGNLP